MKNLKLSMALICALALCALTFVDHASARIAFGLVILSLFTGWLTAVAYFLLSDKDIEIIEEEFRRRLRDVK